MIRTKPGLSILTPEAVAPLYRKYWNSLYAAVPLMRSGLVGRSGNPLLSYGSADPASVSIVGTTAQVGEVVTPWGPGLEWSGTAGVGDGIEISNAQMEFSNDPYLGRTPGFTTAVLFKWDGTTGDQRALISQGAYRLRIANKASPSDIEFVGTALITNTITTDVWYLMIATSTENPIASAGSTSYVYLFNATTGRYLDGNATSSSNAGNVGESIFFGAHSTNDPAVGVTIAGGWCWSRHFGMLSGFAPHEARGMEAFIEDPFGMFRPNLSPFFPASISGVTVTLYATADGTLTNVVDEIDTTIDLYQSVDDDPATPTDADWVNNTSLTASTFFLLTDMPSLFDTATSATIIVRYRGQNWSGASLTLYAQLFQSDESTTLSDEITVATVSGNGAFANTSSITFTNLSAGSKTIWDGARIRFRWA